MTETAVADATEQKKGEGGEAGFTDIEATARRMGWRPEDEFRGPKEKWKPADRYVEDGLNELPIIRERYKVLDSKYDKLDRNFGEVNKRLGETTDLLTEFRDQNLKTAEVAYKRARAQLIAERDAAVASADTVAHQVAVEGLEELEKEKPKPPPEKKAEAADDKKKDPPAAEQQQPKIDPKVEAWVAANPWYTQNYELNAFAVNAERRLLPDYPDLEERLAAVAEDVKKRFPEHFESPRAAARASVAQPTGGDRGGNGAGKKGRRYADLPDEAKVAHDKFTKTMVKDKETGKTVPLITSEKYLADYDWSN